MKALVYHGVGSRTWKEKAKPKIIFQTDAIIKILKTTICGTDLHIMKGSVPTVGEGRILGHEGVGVIEEIGNAVTNFKVGDLVLISCITSCGKCDQCKKGFFGHCDDGGWILGNEIDGCQAEYVRAPHADGSLYHIPKGGDIESYVMLSDILPTGLEVGVLEGKVKLGSIVAIVGAGPVGLAALLTAQFYSPENLIMIDLDDNRLRVAKSMGATHTINNIDGTAVAEVMNITNGKGVDVAIEAIGTPPGWYICEDIVSAGGNIAMLGVHGKSVTLHLERMWKKNFTLSAGLVHTASIPLLMKAVQSEKIVPKNLISHHFKLSEMEKAYETFENAAQHKALKVMLTNDLS